VQEESTAASHLQRQVQDQAAVLLAREEELAQLRMASALADDAHGKAIGVLQTQLADCMREVIPRPIWPACSWDAVKAAVWNCLETIRSQKAATCKCGVDSADLNGEKMAVCALLSCTRVSVNCAKHFCLYIANAALAACRWRSSRTTT
jgi:hypothetical protein